jgi:hypothetical protein
VQAEINDSLNFKFKDSPTIKDYSSLMTEKELHSIALSPINDCANKVSPIKQSCDSYSMPQPNSKLPLPITQRPLENDLFVRRETSEIGS